MKKATLRFEILLFVMLFLLGANSLAQSRQDKLQETLKPMIQNRLEGPRFFVDTLAKQGYTESEVLAACNSIGVDWNARAIQTANNAAEQCQEGTSQLGIAKLLATLGYTNAQISYALANCDIDWHCQAWRTARYLAAKNGGNIDDDSLKSTLRKYGYGEEEIEFACKNRLNDNPLD